MVVLNIGLNGNPWSYEEVENFMFNVYGAQCKRAISEWEGNIEPTVVVKLDKIDVSGIQCLCVLLKQDVIAAKFDGVGRLVYNPYFSQFDDKFFIEF